MIIDRIVITPGPTSGDLSIIPQGEFGATLDWIERTRKAGYAPNLDTRHLIELCGLVGKAGFVDLTGDDRATIYGALLWMADKLKSDQGEQARELWSKKGRDLLNLFESRRSASGPKDDERTAARRHMGARRGSND